VPDVFTYLCANSVRNEGLQPQQASHLQRAMQRHAIVPDVISYTSPISA